MKQYSNRQFAGAQPVILLELVFASKVYRFSTQALNLNDNGATLQYQGGLEDIEIAEQTELIGIDIEGNSATCKVVFDGINLIEYWRRGYILEGAEAEISMILLREGVPQQDYEDRQVLITGYVQQPQFGDPLEPVGFCSFSVERKPFDTTTGGLIHNPDFAINTRTFPALDFDILGSMSEGQIYPIVIAKKGIWNILNDDGANFNVFVSPAYAISNYTPTVGDPYYLLISAYAVEATTVWIRDSFGNYKLCPVDVTVDALGNVYSRVNIITGGGLIERKRNTADEDVEYHVCWSNVTAGVGISGGIKSPFGDGALVGGAEIIMWAMLLGGYDIDLKAWQSVRPFLDTYEFHGYIDDPTTQAWDWLSDSIIRFLPVEVQNGNNGIRPILALLYISTYTQPIVQLETDSNFLVVSSITTMNDTSDLSNDIILYFAPNEGGRYLCKNRINADIQDTSISSSKSLYALQSQGRYGKKSMSQEADWIFERDTAIKVATDLIRANSLPLRAFEVLANAYYGFLQIGDVISITSEELFLG